MNCKLSVHHEDLQKHSQTRLLTEAPYHLHYKAENETVSLRVSHPLTLGPLRKCLLTLMQALAPRLRGGSGIQSEVFYADE